MNDSDNDNLTYVLIDKIDSDEDNQVSPDFKNLENNNELDAHTDLITEVSCKKSDKQISDSYLKNVNYYIAVSLISIITYIILAYSSSVALVELIDLEIPLIILLSLIIVFLSFNWSRAYTYLSCVLILAFLIALSFNYSFIVMIVLFSELVVYSINMIITSNDDYFNKN